MKQIIWYNDAEFFGLWEWPTRQWFDILDLQVWEQIQWLDENWFIHFDYWFEICQFLLPHIGTHQTGKYYQHTDNQKDKKKKNFNWKHMKTSIILDRSMMKKINTMHVMKLANRNSIHSLLTVFAKTTWQLLGEEEEKVVAVVIWSNLITWFLVLLFRFVEDEELVTSQFSIFSAGFTEAASLILLRLSSSYGLLELFSGELWNWELSDCGEAIGTSIMSSVNQYSSSSGKHNLACLSSSPASCGDVDASVASVDPVKVNSFKIKFDIFKARIPFSQMWMNYSRFYPDFNFWTKKD